MEFDPKQEEQPSAKSAQGDLDAEAVSSFNSMEGYDQDLNTLAYRNNPNFQDILLHFQSAEWEECLEKVNQFLLNYPEDKFLLAFKQDVEVRLKQQKIRQQQEVEDYHKKRRSLGLRILAITALSLAVLILSVWAVNVYRANQTQARLAHEAALLAQSLAAKLQTADSFMRAGKPAEALPLYTEIQRIDPSYKDINEKIQMAKQDIAVEDLYQQGTQAIQDGKSDNALEILLKVEELHPKYKDTLQLIQKLEQEQQIASLVKEIHDAYAREDWTGVIQSYEVIQAIDPFIQIPELKAELFISYRNLIVDIAGRENATLDDIGNAEKYYRNALALFPQNKEYASERDEIQKIAVELLANKYYLYGISLLESTNYSIDGLSESIRILTKANSIGSSSPVIKGEIDKAQLFLDSYSNLLKLKWDAAISGFEKLRRKEENYAHGKVKYLLYEAYIARGDSLFAFADFAGASLDYQEAEKFAFSDGGNILRLFQIEVRIAASFHKLGQVNESVEFYHYAFSRLGYKNRLTSPEEKDLLNTINQAFLAYDKGDKLESITLYEIAVEQQVKLYDHIKVAVKRGDTLADIAFRYGCTFESLRVANELGESLTIVQDQEILVPVIPASTQ